MIFFKSFESEKSQELFDVIMEFRDKLTEFIKTAKNHKSNNKLSFEQKLNDNFYNENDTFIANADYNCYKEHSINISVEFPDFYENNIEISNSYISPNNVDVNSIVFEMILHIFPNAEN